MSEGASALPTAYASNPKVKFYYEGRLADGTVFDSNLDSDEPLTVCVGHHEIIPGLEETLEEMEIGERRELVVPPELAYGYPDKKAIQMTKLSWLKNAENLDLHEGSRVKVKSSASMYPIEGRVVHVYDDFVQLDFNHPLAGEDLYFTVEVVGKD